MLRSLVKNIPAAREWPKFSTSVRWHGITHTADEYPTAGTMADVKTQMMRNMALERGYRREPKSREHLLQYQPKWEDLPARTMQDSFTSAIIPLKTDKRLQDLYMSYVGTVRLGRLIEDMDMFAVWVCHKHLQIPNLPEGTALPYTFVTILVDKITLARRSTDALEDVRLSGHVSWVGRSSMEIVVWLEQYDNGQYWKITRALFMMAARNATNSGPAPINPIVPGNEEERKILAGGEERKRARVLRQASSIFKVEPNDFEQTLMYDLYTRTRSQNTMALNQRMLPANCQWLSENCTQSTFAAFPEHRNAHNKVFGGFLMRSALETSWVGAYLYSKARPMFVHISDISFMKPVSVNSIIKASAYVVYTEENYVQMMTLVDIVDAVTSELQTSNIFYSTLLTRDVVPEILPLTYQETMWYIQGKRKFKSSMEDDMSTM